jgi:hypothetical protein
MPPRQAPRKVYFWTVHLSGELTHPSGLASLDEFEVAHALAEVCAEIDVIAAFLAREEKDPESYQGILKRTREVLSVRRLAEGWSSVQSHMSAELHSGLVLLSQFMNEEEPPLDDDVLVELEKEFESWSTRVAQGTLPSHVKAFLFQQIDRCRRAVREYQFRERVAFEDAAISSATDWVRAKKDIEPYADSPEVEGVRSLWPRTEKLSRRTMLIGGAITAILAPLHQAIEIAKETGLLGDGREQVSSDDAVLREP